MARDPTYVKACFLLKTRRNIIQGTVVNTEYFLEYAIERTASLAGK